MFISKVCKPFLIRMQKFMKITFQSDCKGATKMCVTSPVEKIIFVFLCCRYIISVGWDRRINLFSVSYTVRCVLYQPVFFPLMLAFELMLASRPFSR